ncbi:MAG: L-rhamnonate dehydratase [Chloroflexota bacterium]|nr:MAG: L-rhamnonate dehydratase [Chloroflexota bacterium]
MKIVNVRAYPVRNVDRDSSAVTRSPGAPRGLVAEPVSLVLVEVVTDDGVSGVGTVGGFCGAARDIIDGHLRDVVLGEDPRDVERLWNAMYRASARYGSRGAAIEAMSGIDIALWDILGKSAGLPVYRLLGGRTRERVPVYSSHLRDTLSPADLETAAQADVAAGFKAVKLFLTRGPDHGPAGLRMCVEATRRVHQAIGDDIEMMVDAHLRWDVSFTLAYARGVEDLGIRWIEEPIPHDDRGGYARLTAGLPVPIAAGEHEYTRFPFAEMIERRCLGILQPDVNRVGGITEARRIVALASAHSLPVCFHQGWLHSYHQITAFPNCPIGEYFPPPAPGRTPAGNALNWLVLSGEPVARDGAVTVSDAPGFGWEIDREALARYSISVA